MSSKFLRFLILSIQFVCFAVIVAVCLDMIMMSGSMEDSKPYMETVIRVSLILLLTLSYYRTGVSNFNPGDPFIQLFLLFITLANAGVTAEFTAVTGWGLIQPMVNVRLQIFSQFMVCFLLTGYAFNIQNNDYGPISRFLLFGVMGCLFIALLMPATQDMGGLWRLRTPFSLLTVFFATGFLANFILLFSASSKAEVFRGICTVMILAGNYLLIFDRPNLSLIGTALFSVGVLINIVLTLRDSVIL